MRLDAPPLIDDETFGFDQAAGGLHINMPRLYCETIGAPLVDSVLRYCLDPKGPRYGELVALLHETGKALGDLLDGSTYPKADRETLTRIEWVCRAKARAMLSAELLRPWDTWETSQALAQYSQRPS